jgi:tetratricopeptide (TPR) repeat protein
LDLDAVAELYERGLYLRAWEAGRSLGPPARWPGVEGLLLAGRLARHLGAVRASHRLFMRAFRADRRSPEALFYYASSLEERRGPLAAWEFVKRRGELVDAPRTARADWLALHGRILAALRDFDRAEDWISRAEALEPSRPWLCVERAAFHDAADQLDKALAAGRRSLDLQPWYRPAVSSVASSLLQLGREEEALALLQAGFERLESASVTGQLTNVLIGRGDYDGAQLALERLEALLPLLDEQGRVWLRGLRSDVAYHRGDLDCARELLAETTAPFLVTLRERLAARSSERRKVRLPVPWVRQHYLTCAPATLASLGAYWSMPVRHEELARSICYGGTPDHVERHWAESNGWAVREFTVDLQTTHALLDRGVPFTLTTVYPTSAHLQAVIGYDALRGTMFTRDPSGYAVQESLAEPFLGAFRSTGPRGMALVPGAEAKRLDGLELPDEALYDFVYRMKRAFEAHRREDAELAFERMQALAPDHPLTLRARWELALYDGDLAAALAAVEALLLRFPGDQVLELRRVGLLHDLGHLTDARTAVDAMVGRSDVDPSFWQKRAELVRSDARLWSEAEDCLRRALRRRPRDPQIISSLASLRFDQQRSAEAFELYRFAACLSPTSEPPSRSYFWVSRVCGAPDEALRFLRDRVRRAGDRFSEPARTLAWALSLLDRGEEALAALDAALEARPDDTELLLAAALDHGRAGRTAHARGLIERARPSSPRSAWLRAAAELAALEGRAFEALARWREACELEPVDEALARQVVHQIALTEGPDAAHSWLRAAAERAPRNIGMQLLRIGWLESREPAEAVAVSRRLVDLHPSSSSARRALASACLHAQRLEAAEEVARQALELDPLDADAHALLARILLERGERAASARAAREAIRLAVDTSDAIQTLIQSCPDDESRRAALEFVRVELKRQVVFGAGITAYRAAARVLFDPEHVLALLDEAREARPDLWPAWSESIQQLLELGRPAAALTLAETGIARFPLVAGAWSDLALVHRLRSDRPGRRRALLEALEVAPAWGWARRELAADELEELRLDAAREHVERAIAAAPLDSANHVARADLLWASGARAEALGALRHALALDPGNAWAWQLLRTRGAEQGSPGEAPRLADELAAERPDDVRCRLAVAREAGDEPDGVEKRLAALDAAIRLDPRNVEAHDWRALALAGAGRFDEAAAACAPEALRAAPPLELRGRAAWIQALRGERAAALAAMQALVAESPSYYWGWWQIVGWLCEERRQPEARAASRKLVQLAPNDPDAWLVIGRLAAQAGERDEARAAFTRAIDLGPHGWIAGLELFDLLADGNEIDLAVEALFRVEAHAPRDEVDVRKLRAACTHRERATALRLFRELCERPGDAYEPVEGALRLLSAAGWASARDEILDGFLRNGAPSTRALRAAARRCAERWRALDRPLLDAAREGRTAALALYVESLAAVGKRERLRRLVVRERELLRGDTDLWGSVGYAFLALDLRFEAQSWLSDWKKREGVQPWMLLNLALSLRCIDDFTGADEVTRAAIALPRDHTYTRHAGWHALDEALAGRREAVPRLLAEAGPSHVVGLARLLLASDGPTAEERLAYEKLRAEVERERVSYGKDSAEGIAYRRVARAIAQRRGTLLARLRASLGRVP